MNDFLGKMALFVDSWDTFNLRQVDFEKICTSNLALYKTCDMCIYVGHRFVKISKTVKHLDP